MPLEKTPPWLVARGPPSPCGGGAGFGSVSYGEVSYAEIALALEQV